MSKFFFYSNGIHLCAVYVYGSIPERHSESDVLLNAVHFRKDAHEDKRGEFIEENGTGQFYNVNRTVN
jgi:hypothetical protein